MLRSTRKFLSPFSGVRPRYQTRSLFINTESTPNPQSMKFLPGQEVLPEAYGTGMYFQRGEGKEIQKSPLAKSLFAVSGVKGIFLGRDFITVTKMTDEDWPPLKPQLFSAIMDFYADGKRVMVEGGIEVSDTTVLDTDDEIVATIKELIESRVRPSVQEDGGDIFYEGFDPDTGVVSVRLAGSCVGCPSSSVTLRNGVENMLKHYIPEVTGIQDVTLQEGEEDAKLEFRPDTVDSAAA
ncbi:scaffold protein Nfu/NifU N terminal-domain-containing protein [Ochromonadaceae sp. CCMP2298]|nr:scaffold protein Nfu/NifU N terminal-domain-containing protein [Ochromonadaceae sp. CCMP2298]|mmetsp:Transcript_13764/g.30368  ORF Transcript_13764/g.30368 Transcript_13764/m.30368 type:complete len:238 (+) Transcript_13764:137-850(+)